MKTILFVLLFLFATAAVADPVADHRVALKEANATFIAAFEKCEDLAKKDRNHCRGIAKREHTKAVQRADAAIVKAGK